MAVDQRAEHLATRAIETHGEERRRVGKAAHIYSPSLAEHAANVLPIHPKDPREALRALSEEVKKSGEVYMISPERFQEIRVKGFGAGEAQVDAAKPLDPTKNIIPTKAEALRSYEAAAKQVDALQKIMAAAEYYRQRDKFGKNQAEALRIAGIEPADLTAVLTQAADAVIEEAQLEKKLPGVRAMSKGVQRDFVTTRLLHDELFLQKMRDKMEIVEENIAKLPGMSVETSRQQKKEGEEKAAQARKQLIEEIKILDTKWGASL